MGKNVTSTAEKPLKAIQHAIGSLEFPGSSIKVISLWLLVAASCIKSLGHDILRDVLWAVVISSLREWRTVSLWLSTPVLYEAWFYLILTLSLQIFCTFCLHQTKDVPFEKSQRYSSDSFLQPMVFSCRTTHARFFPIKHAFSYSYLFVGVPMDWKGTASTILSGVGRKQGYNQHKTWFSISADDYLERGRHSDGLTGKLQDYLTSLKIDSTEYPYAYLVTAPRFLGWSFNPVSFWYLYDNQKNLAAMILEVNNTFDERRMYFMRQNQDPISDSITQSPAPKFVHTWPKDFHVSPFNDRDGAYSLTAIDPFPRLQPSSPCQIHNQIILKTEDRIKLNTKVFSTEAGVPAYSMSRWQVLWFVARWWWVGFMTNPRILRQARVLWVKKLQVFYRPEVMASSIGRNELVEESNIEPYFGIFLQTMAEQSGFSFRYTPASGYSRGRTQTIKPAPSTNAQPSVEDSIIDINVLTPAFYSELVCSTSIREAFARLCFQPAGGEAMIHTSQHQRLQQALDFYIDSSTRPNPQMHPCQTSSRIEHIIPLLRSPRSTFKLFPALIHTMILPNNSRTPHPQTCEPAQRPPPAHQTDARSSPSPDPFGKTTLNRIPFEDLIRNSNTIDMKQYYRTTLILLLANRFALGYPNLLRFYLRVVRWMILYFLSRSIEILWESYWVRNVSHESTSATHVSSVVYYINWRAWMVIFVQIASLSVLARWRRFLDITTTADKGSR